MYRRKFFEDLQDGFSYCWWDLNKILRVFLTRRRGVVPLIFWRAISFYGLSSLIFQNKKIAPNFILTPWWRVWYGGLLYVFVISRFGHLISTMRLYTPPIRPGTVYGLKQYLFWNDPRGPWSIISSKIFSKHSLKIHTLMVGSLRTWMSGKLLIVQNGLQLVQTFFFKFYNSIPKRWLEAAVNRVT